MTTISGIGNTAIARGYNAGLKVLELSEKDPIELMFSDVEYTTKENDKYSIDGGLAYSKNSLKAIDSNKDGKVTVNEAGALGKAVDLNNDGLISVAENLAYAMYQDSQETLNGVASAKERYKADMNILNDGETAKAQMKKIYDGNKLEERQAQFEQKEQQANPNNNQNAQQAQMDQFTQLIMSIFTKIFALMGFNMPQQAINTNNTPYQTPSLYQYTSNNSPNNYANQSYGVFRLNVQM